MECQIEVNKAKCPCTYEPCSRKGKCCECVQYHRRNGELPGCFFELDSLFGVSKCAGLDSRCTRPQPPHAVPMPLRRIFVGDTGVSRRR